MKASAFQELLASVRDAGSYLRGNGQGVARTDSISARGGRRPMSLSKSKRKVLGPR